MLELFLFLIDGKVERYVLVKRTFISVTERERERKGDFVLI